MLEVENIIKEKKGGHFLYCLLFLGTCFISLFFTSIVHAANLSVSPATGNFYTQNNFTVSVEVNTDQAINGVEGILQFPTDKLEVISINKSHSVMSLWIQEPSFSNGGQTGVVHFSAIKLNPGYTGQKGNVIDVVFRVKSPGVANVSFSSGSILANDGKGSNLLDLFNSAVYSLRQSPIIQPISDDEVTVGAQTILPPVPLVSVWLQDEFGKDILFTSSDGELKWSNSPYTKLTWKIPAGVT